MAEPHEIILKSSPYYQSKKEPSGDYMLSYNSPTESLEPVYFWLLDFMGGPEKVEKLIDNFQSSPGSGHFSELMGKATRMQEEGMKIMQTVGVLIKSVINIVYDLRQFETRLNDYDVANGKKGKERIEGGVMALKQTWLDNVDVKRGNSSVKAMTFSQQGAFVMLLNAFMAAKDFNSIKTIDVNETIRRVLEQRMIEFEEWKKLSEMELRKRYNMEKHYLKSQVDSLKLYSRWATPYFKAAEQLRQGSSDSAALVKAFNTIVLKLVLFKPDAIKAAELVPGKELPKIFEKLKEKNDEGKGDYRKFYSCVIVDFMFRGIPQKVDQHYGFGGKSDVKFRGFALNQDEMDVFRKKMEDGDVSEALKWVQGATETSLKEIQDDLDYFLKDIDDRPKEKDEKSENKGNINPFTALLGIGDFFKKEDKQKDDAAAKKVKAEKIAKMIKEGITPDNYYEKLLRSIAVQKARAGAFGAYDIYKKAHGMASVPFVDFKPKEFEVKTGFLDIFKG